MTKRYSDSNRGFSFIELLVVISIIMVLSSAGVVKYKNVSVKSEDARRKLDIESVRSALEICRSEDGRYPDSIIFGSPAPLTCYGGMVVMNTVPSDPGPASHPQYNYHTGPPFTGYLLTYTSHNFEVVSFFQP